MGSSPSKSDPGHIRHVLPKAESWSTLQEFVATETEVQRQEPLATNTVIKDDEITQVKTFMRFPEQKSKSILNLDLHLNQSKHCDGFADNSPRGWPIVFHFTEG